MLIVRVMINLCYRFFFFNLPRRKCGINGFVKQTCNNYLEFKSVSSSSKCRHILCNTRFGYESLSISLRNSL